MSSYIHPVGAARAIRISDVRTLTSDAGATFTARTITIEMYGGETHEISVHSTGQQGLRILDDQGREMTAAAPTDSRTLHVSELTAWACPECGKCSPRSAVTCGYCGYMPSDAHRTAGPDADPIHCDDSVFTDQ